MANREGARHDYIIERDGTFQSSVNIALSGTSVDLTGYTIEMDIRELDTDETPIYTLTTADGTIPTTDLANGNFDLVISYETTATVFDSIESGVYDIRLISPTGVASYPY